MNVIAFRPRPSRSGPHAGADDGTAIRGTFRSPRGRCGQMIGSVRLQRLVLVPRGAFITGVFTGELHEPDGTLIGVDSRRATAPADLLRDETGLHPIVRPLRLELMGIPVDIPSFAIETSLAFHGGEKRSPGRPLEALPGRPEAEQR
jgi:hypothetical protein